MAQSWIIAGSFKRLRDALGNHRVFPSPSKIPYGGFSPLRLQTRSPPRPSPGEYPDLYATPVCSWEACSPRGHVVGLPIPTRSRPEALGSPTGCSVRPGRRLLWPHPSHSWPPCGLCIPPQGTCGGEWVPNLSYLSVRACLPQYPGEPDRCIRLLLPHPHWSSPSLPWLDIHNSTPLVLAWMRNEAVSGSLALRPARWLALHQQGHLLPSFRRPGRPETDVGYIYAGIQSTPAAGLAPARQAAVWAASREAQSSWRKIGTLIGANRR